MVRKPPRGVRKSEIPCPGNAGLLRPWPRPVTSVMVWFAPRRLPGRHSSPKGRSAIAARRPFGPPLTPGVCDLDSPKNRAGQEACPDMTRRANHTPSLRASRHHLIHMSSHRLTCEIASWISMLPTRSTTHYRVSRSYHGPGNLPLQPSARPHRRRIG